jgi:hypothetical protein
MQYFIFILLILFQELISDNGIYLQKPISTGTSRQRYSLDNVIFTMNRTITHDCY